MKNGMATETHNSTYRLVKIAVGCLLAVLVLAISAAALADVAINETNFPDENFRNYVKKNYDSDGDEMLSEKRIAEIKKIICKGKGITDLKGIEYFTELKSLSCDKNQLTSLDISKNRNLEYLDCSDNKLTSLDVSNNTALITLFCDKNQLTGLDVSKNTKLSDLSCDENQLTSLDVSNNSALSSLACAYNNLTSLDVSKNTALLAILRCDHNQLTSLDVSKNTMLQALHCEYNKLTNLDVGSKEVLRHLCCESNKLTSLDVSNCSLLKPLVERTNPKLIGESTYLWKEYEDSDNIFEDENILSADKTTRVIPARSQPEPEPGPDSDPIDLKDCKINTIKDQKYTGKTLKPKVTVEYNGTILTKGTDYTVSYKKNTEVGKATVTVKGIGKYTGKKTATFKIKPASVKLSSVKGGKKLLTVKWKQGKDIDGYEIQYSLKEDFSDAKTVTIKKADTTETEIKKLKAKKKYYVRIRTFKKVSGKNYTSSWSDAKSAKTKKK